MPTSVEAGLPTPWVGVKERIYWYAYQAAKPALASGSGTAVSGSHRALS